MPYIIQSLLLLLGPALFAASVYMVFGRLIRLVGGERYSIIRVNWLTKIFVLGDVLSFLVQSGGTLHICEIHMVTSTDCKSRRWHARESHISR